MAFGAEGVLPEVVDVIPHHPGGRRARRAERRVALSRITARETLVVQRGLNWGQADGSKGAALVVEAVRTMRAPASAKSSLALYIQCVSIIFSSILFFPSSPPFPCL